MLYDRRKIRSQEFGKFKDYSFDRLKHYFERKYKIKIVVTADKHLAPFTDGLYTVLKGVSFILIREKPDDFEMRYNLIHEVGHHLHGMEERSAHFYALETLFCPKTLAKCLLKHTPFEFIPEALKMPPFYFHRLLEYYDGRKVRAGRYTLYFGHFLELYNNKNGKQINLDDF